MNRDRDQVDGQDQAFEIFDAEWEEQARKLLRPTGFDPELAIRVSRDAIAVFTGDLSEEEFHRRHRDDYLQQFGLDDRPYLIAEDAVIEVEETESDEAGGNKGDGRLSRRTALRFAGAGTVAMLVGQMFSAWNRSANAEEHDHSGHVSSGSSGTGSTGKKVQMGMVIDLEHCDGCLFCVAACKQDNGLSDGTHWIYVLAYEEPDHKGQVNLLPRLCQHCTNAPCVKVCPSTARHRREDGLVLTDYDLCIGCRYCQVSCPYGVNYFQWGDPKTYGGTYNGERRDARGRAVVGDPPRGMMGKCTFCPRKQDTQHERGTTACAAACPHGVLHYGDLNDPNSAPNRYLAKRREENGGRIQTFRMLDDLGTKPNVIYIGTPPSRNAKEVPGPVRYEDWGMVKERRAVLEGPEPWFKRLIKKVI
jgi:Fe-S-cluster-containing dehydrogenase component